MEVKFKFKKGDIVKRKDIGSDELFVIQEAMQIKHIDWNNDGEIVTWKIENRYYLKDSFGEKLKETVNEGWLREYGIESEKKKEENKLPTVIYVIFEAAPYEQGEPIGFFYDKNKAEKRRKALQNNAYSSTFYRLEEVKLLEV